MVYHWDDLMIFIGNSKVQTGCGANGCCFEL